METTLISPLVIVTLLLAIALPVAWLASEFQSRRWLRIVLGLLSLSLSVSIALAVGVLQELNYNSWYGIASAKLLDTTIAEIESGREDQLLTSLRKLRGEFYPTYENRANYDKLVDEFAKQVVLTHAPQN